MGGGIRRLRITPNQTVWIVTIFVLLISIMVGYSVLDNDLGISGQSTISTSTLVKISKLEVKEVTGNVEVSSSVAGNIKGIMETIFTGSGTATFTGTVVNMGSTEAILSTINLLNESNNSSPTCITMSIDGLKVGDTLTPSQEQNFTVTVKSTCDQASTKTNEFSLSYIPVNPSEGTTTIDERITNLENQITSLQTENTELKTKMDEVNGKQVRKISLRGSYYEKNTLKITFPDYDFGMIEIYFSGGWNEGNMSGFVNLRFGYIHEAPNSGLYQIDPVIEKGGSLGDRLTIGSYTYDKETKTLTFPLSDSTGSSLSAAGVFVTIYSGRSKAGDYTVTFS